MEQKKHDLRDDMKSRAVPTDARSQMAGEADLGPLPQRPKSDMHATAPDVGGHLAEGQVTKSN